MGAKDAAETCPTFREGCPFKPSDLSALKDCPAFQDGCAFKQMKSVQDLHKIMADMPHLKGQPELSQADEAFRNFIESLNKSTEEKMKVYGNCPVLSDSGEPQSPANSDNEIIKIALDSTQWSQFFASLEEPFSEVIKAGTSESHKSAESVLFVKNFLKGNISVEQYRQLVSDLYHVYNALEIKLDKLKDDPLVKPIHFPKELNRTEALRKDMDFWFGKDWELSPDTKPSPCTEEYVNRLQQCSAEGVVAHAYTRYMGDLSGGRVLMTKARKCFKPEDKQGLAFYEFANITSPKKFKDDYRSCLDALPIPSKAVSEKIVVEANIAFLLNMRLFSELDFMAGDGEKLQPLETAVEAMKRARDEADPAQEAKCPFAKMGSMLSSPTRPTHKSATIFTSYYVMAIIFLVAAYLTYLVM